MLTDGNEQPAGFEYPKELAAGRLQITCVMQHRTGEDHIE